MNIRIDTSNRNWLAGPLVTPLVIVMGSLMGLAPATGFGADAPKPAANDNACIFSGTISDWRPLDANNLVIWAPTGNTAYHVTLGFPLHDLKGRETMGVIDGNGDGRLCGFGMDQIVINNGFYPEKATVMGMTKLDEAGLVALGEQYKVQLVRQPKDRPVK